MSDEDANKELLELLNDLRSEAMNPNRSGGHNQRKARQAEAVNHWHMLALRFVGKKSQVESLETSVDAVCNEAARYRTALEEIIAVDEARVIEMPAPYTTVERVVAIARKALSL